MKVLMLILMCLFFLLVSNNTFASKWETTEVDFEKDAFVSALHSPIPRAEYPKDYRTIPENFETKEQPDTSLYYYETYNDKHPECVRVNDKLMMCPNRLPASVDDQIAKEMLFDDQYANCDKHLNEVIVCKREKRN